MRPPSLGRPQPQLRLIHPGGSGVRGAPKSKSQRGVNKSGAGGRFGKKAGADAGGGCSGEGGNVVQVLGLGAILMQGVKAMV